MGKRWLSLLLIFHLGSLVFCDDIIEKYRQEVDIWLNKVNNDLKEFNYLAASITWETSIVPRDENKSATILEVAKLRINWKNKACSSRFVTEWLTHEQRRQIYLLCRGPTFSDQQVIPYLKLVGEMFLEFNTPVCLPEDRGLFKDVKNFPAIGDCVVCEPDLEQQMKRTDLTPSQLEWIWTLWHDSVGPRIGKLFPQMVHSENLFARQNGYNNIGECWREELEIPGLEQHVFDLYKEIEPLYLLLHAVMRYKLYKKYGARVVDPKGPIPAHLLGNMWAQDWSPLIDLLKLTEQKIDLNERLRKKNMSVKDMVHEAEDFYMSLSFPKMTEKFWKYSIFEKQNNISFCHGSAGDLYDEDDFRMLMCGTSTMQDFYVIHHEMGHVEYYMAYENQTTIFRDGTNTAIHESIGDAIMLGVYSPQHLHRVRLLSDEELFNNNTHLYLLFLQGLSRIPEIPFSLIIDKFRWDIFRGSIMPDDWNNYYWALNLKYRGIVPPTGDRSDKFDAGAKFHIPDNTPYIRYFLSSIIQVQIFKSMCGISFYGSDYDGEGYFPFDKCDIYGSSSAGKRLLKAMKKGASIQWSEALKIMTNSDEISTKPFQDYYKPIYKWLKEYVLHYNIYVGW